MQRALENAVLSPQAYGCNLHKGAEKGTLTQSQIELVTCFAPDRLHATKDYVSVALQHIPACVECSVDALRSDLHQTVP